MYIPLEIAQFITNEISDNKARLSSTLLWKRFRDKYSFYGFSEYRKMLNSFKNGDFETNTLYYKNDKSHPSVLESYWLDEFRQIINSFNDEDGYSKKIFLLSILENHIGPYATNRIYLNLYEDYRILWWKYKSKLIRTIPNFYKVFVTLKEYDFYDIKLVDDCKYDNLIITKKIWNREDIIDYVDYAYLDDSLFDILFLDSFREKLTKCIIDSF